MLRRTLTRLAPLQSSVGPGPCGGAHLERLHRHVSALRSQLENGGVVSRDTINAQHTKRMLGLFSGYANSAEGSEQSIRELVASIESLKGEVPSLTNPPVQRQRSRKRQMMVAPPAPVASAAEPAQAPAESSPSPAPIESSPLLAPAAAPASAAASVSSASAPVATSAPSVSSVASLKMEAAAPVSAPSESSPSPASVASSPALAPAAAPASAAASVASASAPVAPPAASPKAAAPAATAASAPSVASVASLKMAAAASETPPTARFPVASSGFEVQNIDNFFTLPTKAEIVEAIGYPGQKGGQTTRMGFICTLGRLYYGPGRYDYGRVVMPKGWLANFFYPVWEFCHLMFVADRWIMMRMGRHFFGIGIFFFPMWLGHEWSVAEQEYFKKQQSS